MAMIQVTIPCQRQVMNPRVAASLQEIERRLNSEQIERSAQRAMHDLMVYGTATWKSG